jgi:S1-C subfamily serine protease
VDFVSNGQPRRLILNRNEALIVNMMVELNRKLLALACIGVGCAPLARAQDDDIRRDATVRAVEMVMPTVVNIATKSTVPVRDQLELLRRQFFNEKPYDEYISAGSGVVIDQTGYLLTNEHVVHGAEQIAVRFGTGTNDYEATVIASDAKTDVALLKIKARPGETFHDIKFAREDDLLLGETVIALGNPLGLGASVTRGILSSKSRVALREGERATLRNLLQTDAPINHGNSGGPLVNLRGELIGINAQVVSQDPITGEPVQGIGFAIPIRILEDSLWDIFPTEFVKSYWFGARVKVGSYPLVINSVQPESPSGRAGLKVGDVVMQVNGKVPKNCFDFNGLMASNAPGDISITIRRREELSEVKVRLVPDDSVFNASMVREKLGLTLEKNEYGFKITGVDSNSPAGRAGLQAGMIVRAIDLQEPPKDVTGVAKLLYAKKKGETVRFHVAFVQQVNGFGVTRQGWVDLQPR